LSSIRNPAAAIGVLVCWNGAVAKIEHRHGHTLPQRPSRSRPKKACNLNRLAKGRGRGLTP
jgi:hypothetical protein